MLLRIRYEKTLQKMDPELDSKLGRRGMAYLQRHVTPRQAEMNSRL
jgi:hypothetical protein